MQRENDDIQSFQLCWQPPGMVTTHRSQRSWRFIAPVDVATIDSLLTRRKQLKSCGRLPSSPVSKTGELSVKAARTHEVANPITCFAIIDTMHNIFDLRYPILRSITMRLFRSTASWWGEQKKTMGNTQLQTEIKTTCSETYVPPPHRFSYDSTS